MYESTTSRSFALTGPIALSCRLGAGSVLVRAEAGRTEATVTATPRRTDSDVLEHSTIDLSGSRLTVHVPDDLANSRFGFRPGDREAVDLVIDVPADTVVKLGAHSAEVRLTGRFGDVDVSCGSSAVTVDEVAGQLRARLGSGDLSVGPVSGSANIKGGSGEVRIAEARSDLSVTLGSGELQLGLAAGPVRLRSGSGGAVIESAAADLDLLSGSGAFSIGLPAGQQARLDVITGSGSLRTEMPLEHNASASQASSTVRIRTGSGDVQIHRARPRVPSAG